MHNKANLQDIFLLQAKRDKLPVTMFLMNGFQMRGVITGFDALWSFWTATADSRSSTSTPFPPSRRCGPWT